MGEYLIGEHLGEGLPIEGIEINADEINRKQSDILKKWIESNQAPKAKPIL